MSDPRRGADPCGHCRLGSALHPGADVMTPQRIQRRRTAGWRMPEGAIYVGRSGPWSNPFAVGQTTPSTWPHPHAGVLVRDRAHAVELFTELVSDHARYIAEARDALAGRDLVCWCPLDQPCHADVLLDLANARQLITTDGDPRAADTLFEEH